MKRIILFLLLCLFSQEILAAQIVYLKSQSANILQSLNDAQLGFKKLNTTIDNSHLQHAHYVETFFGYPIWGANIILHAPQNQKTLFSSAATVTGIIYQNINADVANTVPLPSQVVVQHIANEKSKRSTIEKIIFIDKSNRAHWAYLISNFVTINKVPTYIVDAVNFTIYQHWNNVEALDNVDGGGFGGNVKIGEHAYEGLSNTLPKLSIQRDATQKLCFLQNDQVAVYDLRTDIENPLLVQFACDAVDPEHANVYWSGSFDAVKDAYSQNNDALYIGKIINDMYLTWYHLAVLKKDNTAADETPAMLKMNTHWQGMDNAIFLPMTMEMYFGEGDVLFYPMVTLDVGAHEITHGFTMQRSGLQVFYQPGSINESFSDMASQAALYFSTGKNNWEIGADITKSTTAYRYMNDPTKDCVGIQPGDQCSIDNVASYNDDLDEHFAAGIFNKAFYLLATSPNWNTKKAFDVMVQANIAYWRPTTSFQQGADCALKAAGDLHYEASDVISAFAGVGISANADGCY